MLNRIRSLIEPISTSLGTSLGRAGVSPNYLTGLGFVFAVLAGVSFGTLPSKTYVAAGLIVLSGFMDILDGAVARAMQKVSKTGSFTDSTLDRLAEIAIYSGIIYSGYGLSPLIVLLALSFSLIVSYTRAKSESLSIQISGIGVGERAERLIVLVIFSLVGYIWIGVYIVLILAVFTFLQRYAFVAKSLRIKSRRDTSPVAS